MINNRWSSELRDFKLSVITGDLDLKVELVNLNRFKKELKYIKDNFTNDIITGSLALNLFGIIERNISDIDIIIDDRERYEDYTLGILYGRPLGEHVMDNRLGYKMFKVEKTGLFKKLQKTKYYKIDFFESSDSNYIEVDYDNHIYKLHNPIDILNTKSNLDTDKHDNDLLSIFGLP